MNVYLVHGFLGLPQDWQETTRELEKLLPTHTQFYLSDLWKDIRPLSPDNMFYKWADQFSQQLEGEDNWLIGYSLGGRLLSHIPPEVYPRVRGLTLISSNWGLEDPHMRDVRFTQDQEWARKFLLDSWKEVIQEWDSQSVFRGDRVRPLRAENNYSRVLLAHALEEFSLGRQKSFWSHPFPFPVQYVYGEDDEKFSQIAQSLRLRRPDIYISSLAGGHNLPVNEPFALAEVLAQFYGDKLKNK